MKAEFTMPHICGFDPEKPFEINRENGGLVIEQPPIFENGKDYNYMRGYEQGRKEGEERTYANLSKEETKERGVAMDKIAFAQQLMLANGGNPVFSVSDAIKAANRIEEEFCGTNADPGFVGTLRDGERIIFSATSTDPKNDNAVAAIPGTREFFKENFEEFYQKLQCNFACFVSVIYAEPSKDEEIVLSFFDASRRFFVSLVKRQATSDSIPYFVLFIPKEL